MSNTGDFGLRLAAWLTAAIGLALVATLSDGLDRHLSGVSSPAAPTVCFRPPSPTNQAGLDASPSLGRHSGHIVDKGGGTTDN